MKMCVEQFARFVRRGQYFFTGGFQRYPYEHTLNIKYSTLDDILIVCLYVYR